MPGVRRDDGTARSEPAVTPKGRCARLLGLVVLLAGGVGAAALSAAGPAGATSCGAVVPAGSSCTLTGFLDFSGGPLTLAAPSSLGWTGTLNGFNQNLVDTTTADQSYVVNDATGSGAGWDVTVSATQFTTGTASLGNTGTFSTNGSIASSTSTTAPDAACSTDATCTLPTDTTSYPVAITTAASSPSAVTIYDASTGTGLGSIVIGNADPVGWWLKVPANAAPGSYTSTITLEVNSGP